jgi:mRNA interferase RelE/StbE
MNIEIRKSFVKDTQNLPTAIQKQIALVIEQIENAKELKQLKNCKKLKSSKKAYRIKLGQYRLGFYFDNETLELVRILGRKEIYRFFP